ncbi:MAG: hypothetical protein ACKPKO_32565, partial [Candidatus Fonsibacter sp.]
KATVALVLCALAAIRATFALSQSSVVPSGSADGCGVPYPNPSAYPISSPLQWLSRSSKMLSTRGVGLCKWTKLVKKPFTALNPRREEDVRDSMRSGGLLEMPWH